MDMISRMELEDAMKNQKKVEDRIREVALKVAGIEGEIDNTKPRKWRLQSWHVSLADFPEEPWREYTQVTVRLEIDWMDRPVTEKHGDPENDDSNDYFRDESHMIRMVTFPRRFLLTDDWDQELEDRTNTIKIARQELEVKNLSEAIARNQKEVKRLYDLRVAAQKELATRKARVPAKGPFNG